MSCHRDSHHLAYLRPPRPQPLELGGAIQIPTLIQSQLIVISGIGDFDKRLRGRIMTLHMKMQPPKNPEIRFGVRDSTIAQ